MEDPLNDLVSTGRLVMIFGLREQPELMLSRINIIPDLVPGEQVFVSKECLVWVNDNRLHPAALTQ